MQRGARPARPFTHISNSFLLFLAPPASCRFVDDVGRSGASLATISLTTSAPIMRGARPARSFTHFSNSFLLFWAPLASCRMAGWLFGWLAGWLLGSLAGWLVGWLAGFGSLAGWVAGWLGGWLASGSLLVGWLAGWLGGWVAG